MGPISTGLGDIYMWTVHYKNPADGPPATIAGVAGVDAIGGFEKQYNVQPDPAKLVGLNLSFGEIAAALEANNANRGAGYLEDNGEGFVVRSVGRLESIDEIGDVVVATRGGVPIRIKDIADVQIGRDLRTGSASESGQEVVLGTALMRSARTAGRFPLRLTPR